MNQNKTIIQILTKTTILLENYCIALQNSNKGKALENIIQARVLCDLLNTIDIPNQFSDCAGNLKNAVEQSITATESSSSKEDEQLTEETTFEDIIGNESAKESLYQNVIFPLLLSDKNKFALKDICNQSIGNVLLYGPPGTGKTILAKAVAYHSKASFFTLKPSEILSKYQGESEKFINNLFITAKQQRKSIIFFDEFDALAIARSQLDASNGNNDGRKLLSELLIQLTEIKLSTKNNQNRTDFFISVIAATNRVEDIDEAVLRRFESKVFVGLPNEEQRQLMIAKNITKINHSLTHGDIALLSKQMDGWSGSDIEMVCREAAMAPLRRSIPMTNILSGINTDTNQIVDKIRKDKVVLQDFADTLQKLMKGCTGNQMQCT